MTRRRTIFGLGTLLIAAALWYGLFASRSPQGQPPLASMDLAALRSEFNRAAGGSRVILLLSPT